MSGDRGWLAWRLAVIASALAAVSGAIWFAWRAWDAQNAALMSPVYIMFTAIWIGVAAWGFRAFRDRRGFWLWLGGTGWNAIIAAIWYPFVLLILKFT